jgi:hypothetical protein
MASAAVRILDEKLHNIVLVRPGMSHSLIGLLTTIGNVLTTQLYSDSSMAYILNCFADFFCSLQDYSIIAIRISLTCSPHLSMQYVPGIQLNSFPEAF